MAEAFIYDHIRTPRGRGKANGSLHEVKPIDLVVGLLDEVKTRNPGLDPNRVDDVVLGVVSPVGDQGADIAKTAAIAIGAQVSLRSRVPSPWQPLCSRRRLHTWLRIAVRSMRRLPGR